MVNEILDLLDLALMQEWLGLPDLPKIVTITIDGQIYSLSDFVTKIRQAIANESYEKARDILESDAADLRMKMMRLLQIGEEVEQALCREVRKVLPGAIREEDYT